MNARLSQQRVMAEGWQRGGRGVAERVAEGWQRGGRGVAERVQT